MLRQRYRDAELVKTGPNTWLLSGWLAVGNGPTEPTEPTEPSGTNILFGKSFDSDVAESVDEPGPITALTDGDANTRWISRPQSPVNLSIDAGGVYDFSQLVVTWAADTIRNYAIAVSMDGSTWTTIITGSTNNTQKQTVSYTSFSNTAKGRYIRITGTDRWNSAWGNSIWEVEAYGTVDSSYPVGTVANFTATVASDTQINLAWTYSGSALSGYTLRRNGTTIASPAAGVTSYNDTGLTAGTTYNYTLTGNFTAGGTTNTASVSRKTTSPGGTGWDSGISNVGDIKNVSAAFSTWRGEECTANRFWLSGSSNQDLAGYYLGDKTAGWTGALDYAIGAPPGAGVSWQSAAAGG